MTPCFGFLSLPFPIGLKSQRETTCFQDTLSLIFDFTLSDWIKQPTGNNFFSRHLFFFAFTLSDWIKKPKGDTISRHLVFVIDFTLSDWIKQPKGNTFSRHLVVLFLLLPFLIGLKSQRETPFQDTL